MAKDITIVQSKHIELGIKKYEGQLDKELQSLILSAGYEYTPYVFKDGRILLVLPYNISAILYANKAILFDKLQLA
ncbi:MAG: hypothetical protein H6579_03715 [Chitinophagales bacterium]|nr:hypothetical protein [Bacteroidota bacterium]MCB9256218.1 hypothetical protein [Chitinophagales bacterium]